MSNSTGSGPGSEKIPPHYRRLEGSRRTAAPGAVLVGLADPAEELSVTIRVRRRLDAPPSRDQEYWAAIPPGQRKYLSREEFAGQFGAAIEDLQRVTDFAGSEGLTIVRTSVSERTVHVSGTVAQMNRAFRVELGHYKSPTEEYRGREGHVHLPEAVVEVVEGVFGLDNRKVAHHGSDPTGASPLTPPQVAKLYNFPTSPCAIRQTIGILELGGGFVKADLDAFFSGLGLGTPAIQQISVHGGTNAPGADRPSDLEVTLDIDVAGSVAPGANIAVYFAPDTSEQSFLDAVLAAVFDVSNNPTVLSISWAGPETTWTTAGIKNMSSALQDAASLGITVFVCSGDVGSAGMNPTHLGSGGVAVVNYPASDPFVTACGGTVITNVAGGSFNEGTWNDSGGATGGGVSDVFPLPSWQVGKGVPFSANPARNAGRGVPDISGNASPFSGYTIIVGGSKVVQGGTSAVAPLYAGLVALLNSIMGKSVGYLNPALYSLGAGIIQDINDGVSNAWAGDLSGAPFYTSGPGWDACTGLGRVDGGALLKALLAADGMAAVINADDPFGYGSSWLNVDDSGGDDTGDDIELGNRNDADDNDATVIEVAAANNAALVGQNLDSTVGGVGVFGRSKGCKGAVGVAGQSETGCGVYGIGTQGISIGVAGRSMGAGAVEQAPLEEVVGEPVGVLGNSTNGPGVRGHGGPLLPLPPGQKAPPLPSLAAAPGGVFSSGQLQETIVTSIGGLAVQVMSLDPLAQLNLIPSINAKLPVSGRLGDIYLNVIQEQSTLAPVVTLTVTMFLCVVPGDGFPSPALWAPFQLGAARAGG